MKKRVFTMFLAAAMTMSLAVSAADEAITDQQDNTTVASKGSYDVTLTGTVEQNSKLISVVMPTSIDFIISTTSADSEDLADVKGSSATKVTGTATDGTFEKIYQGTGTVTNNSEVAVKLELTSSLNQKGNLLNLMDLKLKAEGVQDTAISNTIELEAGKDYTSDGTLAASLAAKQDGDTNGGQLTLKIDGAGAQGTTSSGALDVRIPNGEYTILTTLKVSLAD